MNAACDTSISGVENLEKEVEIKLEKISLAGYLDIPKGAKALVVFVHGSGSSRLSPRNRYVAQYLSKKGLATLLFDLLTIDEEAEDEVTAELRFDIKMLSDRLVKVTKWAESNPDTRGLRVMYFGASTGAAAALVAAARFPDLISAVVSRGGRPDLALEWLSKVKAPTLLIVGGNDSVVIGMNQRAQAKMRCENELTIIPCATHLFEEPGALEEVAKIASSWFLRHV